MASARPKARILPGDPPVEIRLRISARARRITLRVSALDGQVTLTRPAAISEREAMSFAAGKARWIRDRLAGQMAARRPAIGGTIPVSGRERGIVAGVPGMDGDRLRVRPDRAPGPQVALLLRGAARDRLARAVALHAGTLGVSVGRTTLRDTRSRWGSCNHRGDLMFSWRLIMAPPGVLDYVAAHEVAHRRRMDHSPAYWQVCESLCPDWRTHRDWLRAHGAALHAWRFGVED